MTLRKSEDRGHVQHGWLESRHTFSFGSYYDQRFMGFRCLRVINEDRVAGGSGFAPHPHRDVEILSYVLSGALQHADSMGHRAVVEAGDVQRISAGTGVEHSEINHSKIDSVHFLQIWIQPEVKGVEPSYAQQSFARAPQGRLSLVAAKDGREGSIRLLQDVDLFLGVFGGGDEIGFDLRPGRHVWVQVADGNLHLNGLPVEAGDGVAFNGETSLKFSAVKPSRVLLFDLK